LQSRLAVANYDAFQVVSYVLSQNSNAHLFFRCSLQDHELRAANICTAEDHFMVVVSCAPEGLEPVHYINDWCRVTEVLEPMCGIGVLDIKDTRTNSKWCLVQQRYLDQFMV